MSLEKTKKKFLIITTVPVSLFFFKGQVQILKKEFDIEVVTGPGIGFEKFCTTEKVIGHRIFGMKREISLFSDIKSLYKLIKLFRKVKPEIIHGNTPKGGLLSMIAGWVTKIPHRIYCVHGLRYQGETGLKRKLLMFLESVSCKMATEVFTVSFGVKKILKDDNIFKKNVNVIWNGSVNGIDVAHFFSEVVDESSLIKKFNIDDNNLMFGFVGRLVKDKGVNELIEAFVEINKEHNNTRLLLVGDYEETDPVKEETKKEIANNPNIIFAGWQTDIRSFLKIMDLFVFPSYREGFGVSLMEAAAMNVPAISSNITGCNEIIKDGYNGRLIQSKSKDDLKNTMEQFIEKPKLLDQMSSVSRQYVINKYEQKKLWNKALEKYMSIIYDK